MINVIGIKIAGQFHYVVTFSDQSIVSFHAHSEDDLREMVEQYIEDVVNLDPISDVISFQPRPVKFIQEN